MLTTQEIRQLGTREMMDELQKSRRELLRTQFDVRGGTSKEVHMVKNLKRYIAKLQTISKEMKMDPNAKAETGKTVSSAAPAAEEKKTASAPAPAKAKKAAAAKKPAAKAAKTPAKKAAPKSAKK